LGETIKVRFQLISDSGTVADGFYFDDFKVNTIDQSILGTEAFETINAKVYPNPVKDHITIMLPNAIETSIEVYSISGQLIKSTSTNLISTEISLKDLNSGIYILKLQTPSSSGIYKIVKE